MMISMCEFKVILLLLILFEYFTFVFPRFSHSTLYFVGVINRTLPASSYSLNRLLFP